jgi:hypothetical protein
LCTACFFHESMCALLTMFFFVQVCVNLLLVWVVIFWIFWLWPLLLWMPGPQRLSKMCYVVLHSYFKFIGSHVSDI